MMSNPLKEMIAASVERKREQGIPIPKYTFAVLVTGNSRQEIASAISRLETDMAMDWRDRDQIDSMDGTTSVVMEHTSPEQTPKRYMKELMDWRDRQRAERAAAVLGIEPVSSGGIS